MRLLDTNRVAAEENKDKRDKEGEKNLHYMYEDLHYSTKTDYPLDEVEAVHFQKMQDHSKRSQNYYSAFCRRLMVSGLVLGEDLAREARVCKY